MENSSQSANHKALSYYSLSHTNPVMQEYYLAAPKKAIGAQKEIAQLLQASFVDHPKQIVFGTCQHGKDICKSCWNK